MKHTTFELPLSAKTEADPWEDGGDHGRRQSSALSIRARGMEGRAISPTIASLEHGAGMASVHVEISLSHTPRG